MGGKILGFSRFFGKILRHISSLEWFWQKLLYQFMLLTYMAEILVYKTAEEAKKQLEKYERDNREAFEEFEKSFGEGEDRSERLKKQRYFFAAELAAYVDDGPGRYYYESQHFPFLGWTELYDDIPSLAQGVKNAVKHQTPKNIETILYTVRDHDAENKEMKELAEESRMIAENLPSEGIYGVDKKELSDFLEEFRKLESSPVRGLTKQERQEFVRLYGQD